MSETLPQFLGMGIAIAMLIAWFWKGMGYAMYIYIGSMAAVFAAVVTGGPQMIAGVITGVIANELTHSIRKRK